MCDGLEGIFDWVNVLCNKWRLSRCFWGKLPLPLMICILFSLNLWLCYVLHNKFPR